MKQFIKLSQFIININHIKNIYILPEKKYYIYIASHSFSGFCFYGTGILSSDDEKIIVCHKKTPHDYNTITDWINSINQ